MHNMQCNLVLYDVYGETNLSHLKIRIERTTDSIVAVETGQENNVVKAGLPTGAVLSASL